jgi:hypothetical protein
MRLEPVSSTVVDVAASLTCPHCAALSHFICKLMISHLKNIAIKHMTRDAIDASLTVVVAVLLTCHRCALSPAVQSIVSSRLKKDKKRKHTAGDAMRLQSPFAGNYLLFSLICSLLFVCRLTFENPWEKPVKTHEPVLWVGVW